MRSRVSRGRAALCRDHGACERLCDERCVWPRLELRSRLPRRRRLLRDRRDPRERISRRFFIRVRMGMQSRVQKDERQLHRPGGAAEWSSRLFGERLGLRSSISKTTRALRAAGDRGGATLARGTGAALGRSPQRSGWPTDSELSGANRSSRTSSRADPLPASPLSKSLAAREPAYRAPSVALASRRRAIRRRLAATLARERLFTATRLRSRRRSETDSAGFGKQPYFPVQVHDQSPILQPEGTRNTPGHPYVSAHSEILEEMGL